jgi:hypothetical protein
LHGLAMLQTARLLDADTRTADALDVQVRSVARKVIYGISK